MKFFKDPKVQQKIAFGVLFIATVIVLLPVLTIIFLIISRGYKAITWEFLTSMPINGMKEGGILPAIVGTLSISYMCNIYCFANRCSCCNISERVCS